ncbi:MAG: ATP-binding cassette domain-containing protein, partial [Anaerolineales bacterium]
YGLMMAFLLPVQDLVGLGGKLEQVEGQLNRLEDVLNYTEDSALVHEDLSTETPTARLQGKLELRGLTFGYDRLGKPLIEDFDLTLKPGDRVALVGRSGSGKSTVAKLIAGIYQPWAGEIMFDGQPREAIPRPILTHSLGMVDQDILLFEGSVRDNLTLWDDTIRQSEVVAAARDAHIHAVILGRPGGYDSQVEENGRNFSGGQRQRLEIARALVTNPSILVLDEATSALDPVTEGIIDQHLRRRGCTTVIVAHRLSTIRDADEIIVLDKGKIVQRGTHQSLYRQKGAYRDLIAADDYESDDDPLEAIYDRLQEDARDDEH